MNYIDPISEEDAKDENDRIHTKTNSMSNEVVEIKDESILAYPNPTTDFLNIEIFNASNNNSLFLYDISGKKVFSAKLNSSMNNLDLRYLKSGIYSYQISNGNQLLKSDKLILK